jgi:hypothetical protein
LKFVPIRGAVLSLLTLAAAFAVKAETSQLAVHGQGFIVNHAYGKCLDFASGDLSNNVNLQLWSCGGRVALNQQWNFYPAGSYPNGASSYIFQNAMNYTCAAVEDDSLADGAKIVQRWCDASNPSQHWIQTATGLLGTRTRWMNGRSGKCLDAWTSADGTVLQQYACAQTSNWPQQGFRIDIIPTGS